MAAKDPGEEAEDDRGALRPEMRPLGGHGEGAGEGEWPPTEQLLDCPGHVDRDTWSQLSPLKDLGIVGMGLCS